MVLNNSQAILSFIQTQGYFIIFIIMLLEGAIITYVASFASSLGIFNIYLILIISILGSVIADLIYYSIGRFLKNSFLEEKIIKLIKQDKKKEIKEFLKNNLGKTILIIKLVPILPIPGFIIIGNSKSPFKKVILYSVVISLFYSLLFVSLGFFSGLAFNSIYKYIKYSEIIVGAIIILMISSIFILKKILEKISEKIKKF